MKTETNISNVLEKEELRLSNRVDVGIRVVWGNQRIESLQC